MNFDNLAKSKNLGQLVTEHPTEFFWKSLTWSLGIGMPIILIYMYYGIIKAKISVDVAIISSLILYLLAPTLLFIEYYVNRYKKLLLYEQGLIYIDKDYHIAVRYGEIQDIKQSLITYYYNGIATPTHYKYTVTIKNKTKPLIFNRQFKDIKRIGAYLQSQVFDYQYPIVNAAFNRGELINFGCLSLNQDKLLFETKILPWTDIKNIKLHQGLLYIYTKKNTWTIPVALISNIYVLLSLIDEIILPASESVIIQRQPQRGDDRNVDLNISLQEAISGCRKQVRIIRMEICDECNGFGTDNRGDNCMVCNGDKRNEVVRNVDITIPPNAASGNRLEIIGEGNKGLNGGESGNLYVYLEVKH